MFETDSDAVSTAVREGVWEADLGFDVVAVGSPDTVGVVDWPWMLVVAGCDMLGDCESGWDAVGVGGAEAVGNSERVGDMSSECVGGGDGVGVGCEWVVVGVDEVVGCVPDGVNVEVSQSLTTAWERLYVTHEWVPCEVWWHGLLLTTFPQVWREMRVVEAILPSPSKLAI